MSNTTELQIFAKGAVDLSSLSQELTGFSNEVFAGFGNIGNFLRVEKTGFKLGDEEIDFRKCFAVLLASNAHNHAVWYAHKYQPGQAAQAPDLVWLMDQPGRFPDALPAYARSKVKVNDREMWDFAIRRRTVWARFEPSTGIDLNNPFIFDIPSSSMFGKSNTAGAYKWAEIPGYCRQLSKAYGIQIPPCAFVMKIIPDPKGVQGTVLFSPVTSPEGNLSLLSVDAIREVLATAKSPAVQALKDVTEKLTYGEDEKKGTDTSELIKQAAQPKPQPKPAAAQPTTAQADNPVDNLDSLAEAFF